MCSAFVNLFFFFGKIRCRNKAGCNERFISFPKHPICSFSVVAVLNLVVSFERYIGIDSKTDIPQKYVEYFTARFCNTISLVLVPYVAGAKYAFFFWQSERERGQ